MIRGGRFNGGRFAAGRFVANRSNFASSASPAASLPNGAVLWLDPSDMSTLFQDAAGTVPVTAPGQPVGLILDKSGNGFHAVQSVNDNFRPTFLVDGNGRGFVRIDGIDDYMLISSRLNLPVNPALTIIAGLVPSALTRTVHRIVNIGRGSGMLAVAFGSDGWSWRHSNGNHVFQPSPVGVPAVATFARSAGSTYGQSKMRLNGVEQATARSANSSNVPVSSDNKTYLFVGDNGVDHAPADLFELLVFGRELSPAETSSAESHVGQKMGIAL